MTHTEFTQLLISVKSLTPTQMRRLVTELNTPHDEPKRTVGRPSSKDGTKRAKLARPKKPLTRPNSSNTC
jgi:hypothetical protein